MLELSCWSFCNYPGEKILSPLASQANFEETSRGRMPSDQQSNCPKINSLIPTFTGWGQNRSSGSHAQHFRHGKLYLYSSKGNVWERDCCVVCRAGDRKRNVRGDVERRVYSQ